MTWALMEMFLRRNMRLRIKNDKRKRKPMKKEKIRLALIGAGSMANSVHYPSLAEFPDVEMAGLCDLAEDKLIATAKSKEMHKYTGFFAENRHFIDCLREDKQPMPNLSDSVKTMELVDRIYHSQM